MPKKGPKSNSVLLSQQKLGGLGNDKLERPPKVLHLPWHSATRTVGGQVWYELATAAHLPGTGTAQRGWFSPSTVSWIPPAPPRELPSTFRAWSLSSRWDSSLPEACAILFPATRFPTIIEAGPTSTNKFQKTRWELLIHNSHMTSRLLF